MPFEQVHIASFRNIAECDIPLSASRIFLLGENGQGKTNFLEALYVLCYASSFRTHADRDLLMHGSDAFLLRADWKDSFDAPFADRMSLFYRAGGKKEVRLGDKLLTDRKELVAHNPAVVFCHEDFGFAAGEPEERRFFFDQCAGMLWNEYIDTLRSYKRVLKHRNAALKSGEEELVASLDIQFARFGMELMQTRVRLAALFHERFPLLYDQVARLGTRVNIDYRPSWSLDSSFDQILAYLADHRARDLELKTSFSGPHRDRWVFVHEERNFAAYASTGQLRLASLVLRIVQAYLFAQAEEKRTGKRRYPLLLLDDVLLELDGSKRKRFFELLPDPSEGVQAVFTFLPEEPWRDYADRSTMVLRVEHGRFTREESI